MAGSRKRTAASKTETSLPCLMYVSVGDRSNDGHGRHDKILFRTNYAAKDIEKAYTKACKASGVCLHDGRSKAVLQEYEDGSLSGEVLDKLKAFGIDLSYHESWDESVAGGWDYLFCEDDGVSLGVLPQGCAFLFMEMARVQMAKDGLQLVFKEEKVPLVNENFYIGYGCYN